MNLHSKLGRSTHSLDGLLAVVLGECLTVIQHLPSHSSLPLFSHPSHLSFPLSHLLPFSPLSSLHLPRRLLIVVVSSMARDCTFTTHHLILSHPQSMVSGGVDSTVCTALLNTAWGKTRLWPCTLTKGYPLLFPLLSLLPSLPLSCLVFLSFLLPLAFLHVLLPVHSLSLLLPPHLPSPLPPPVINAAHQFYSAQTIFTYHTADGQLQQRMALPLHSVTIPEEKRKLSEMRSFGEC